MIVPLPGAISVGFVCAKQVCHVRHPPSLPRRDVAVRRLGDGRVREPRRDGLADRGVVQRGGRLVFDEQVQVVVRAVATVQNHRALLLAVPRFVLTASAVVDAVLKGQAQRVGVANRGALGHGLPRVEPDVLSVHAGHGETRVAGSERTGRRLVLDVQVQVV